MYTSNRRATILPLALALTSFSCASTNFSDRSGFSDPEGALDVIIEALRLDNTERLSSVFGARTETLVDSGDEVTDAEGRRRFLELYDEKHAFEYGDNRTATLYIGEMEWPFPIPFVRQGGFWFLDTDAGLEEIVDRRVGRNELSAQQVCLALVDAQYDYAHTDWNGNGIYEYAERIRSSDGTKDGLYWPTTGNEPRSPVGEVLATAEEAGMSVGDLEQPRESFHGYLYRILTAQGSSAPGGAHSYMAGDAMIGGFAILAYPLRYGDSGVKSFLVSHNGVLYEKDLGEKTTETATSMEAFDPGEGWSEAVVE